MFEKILIANRGEIACRIIHTARRMGIKTVAVYSSADAHARHVRLADEAVLIGPPSARESYLCIEAILEAARKTGAQAIHPGYGFLSENEAFCQACEKAGVVFIGPPLAAIRAMGLKSEAKKRMEAAGVPLTPGYHGDDQDPVRLHREADAIGYPVLIKASAGGGGKGMRLVEASAEFMAALASCQREALSSFGDAHVLIEKYIVRPRHIEIQVFGDRHGHVVSLFERDCSVQRRHQKVLEEAPAPGMSPERRAAMGQAAVDAAKAVGYVGAGTVEFITSQSGEFYFMEMNTRLQVEHPVTEMITGLDLVEWQLRVAFGEALPLPQEALSIQGHALEARIYAEDPDKGFLPSTGRLLHLAVPSQGVHVRVDTGVEEGDEISPHYDPMIAKLIVWDHDREKARLRLLAALADYRIVGVANNVAFLSRLVACPAFANADLDTGLIERESPFLFPGEEVLPEEVFFLAALAERLRESERDTAHAAHDPASPWALRDAWQLNGPATRRFLFGQGSLEHEVCVEGMHAPYTLAWQGRRVQGQAVMDGRGTVEAEMDGRRFQAHVIAASGRRHVFLHGRAFMLTAIDPLFHAGEGAGAEGGLMAPMPGKVIALLASPDEALEKGAPLLVLEAMKMEHTIKAPAQGTVRRFLFAVGDQVNEGDALLEFEATTAEAVA